MSSFRYHQRYFVPARCRSEYAQLVSAWWDFVCKHYGPDNVQKQGVYYVAKDDRLARFVFADGATHLCITPLCPSELLTVHQSHDKARQALLKIARNLMREASAADERAFNQQYPMARGNH